MKAGDFRKPPAEGGKMKEVQRKYKDTVFRMLFREKKALLSLYNAVNGTH